MVAFVTDFGVVVEALPLLAGVDGPAEEEEATAEGPGAALDVDGRALRGEDMSIGLALQGRRGYLTSRTTARDLSTGNEESWMAVADSMVDQWWKA